VVADVLGVGNWPEGPKGVEANDVPPLHLRRPNLPRLQADPELASAEEEIGRVFLVA